MGRYSLDKAAVQGSKPWAGTKEQLGCDMDVGLAFEAGSGGFDSHHPCQNNASMMGEVTT